MTQETEGYYEVSADWLKACGYGNGEQAKVFPVVRSWMAAHLPMVTVKLDDGREWDLIASWRGRYVGKPEANIQDLVTPENVEAYNATPDKWLFAHDELDAAGIPSTAANIDALETALEKVA